MQAHSTITIAAVTLGNYMRIWQQYGLVTVVALVMCCVWCSINGIQLFLSYTAKWARKITDVFVCFSPENVLCSVHKMMSTLCLASTYAALWVVSLLVYIVARRCELLFNSSLYWLLEEFPSISQLLSTEGLILKLKLGWAIVHVWWKQV